MSDDGTPGDKATGNWFGQHKALTAVGAFVLLVIVLSLSGGDEEGTTDTAGSNRQMASASPADAEPTEAPPAEPDAACTPAAAAVKESVSEGRNGEAVTLADGGQVVPLSGGDYGNFQVVYATRVDPGGEIGTWALGSAEGGGPLFALNDVAREATDWGSAATAGSPADQQRMAMENSAAARQAVRCVG